MTKKDYTLISFILKTNLDTVSKHFKKDTPEHLKIKEAIIAYIKVIIDCFVIKLLDENPRFNKDKFLIACGIINKSGAGNFKPFSNK